MSARVLNPTTTTSLGEMGRNLGGGGGGGAARVAPSRAALARVRRDLFGPVDHAAARALAEKELRAQAALDQERWGFDFRLELPRENARYEWEAVGPQEVVPEPYALRGMPYLRRNAPGTPRKQPGTAGRSESPGAGLYLAKSSEHTPPQEKRLPDNGDELRYHEKMALVQEQPTTPLPPSGRHRRKQSSITGELILELIYSFFFLEFSNNIIIVLPIDFPVEGYTEERKCVLQSMVTYVEDLGGFYQIVKK